MNIVLFTPNESRFEFFRCVYLNDKPSRLIVELKGTDKPSRLIVELKGTRIGLQQQKLIFEQRWSPYTW